MTEKIKALLQLSKDIGCEDRQLAILGEGNTSVKLNNEQFISRAPAEIIQKQKAAQAALLEKRAKLEERLRSLD